jgi:hypothetical protein
MLVCVRHYLNCVFLDYSMFRRRKCFQLSNYLVCKNFYNLFEEEFVQLWYVESSVEKRLHESFPKIFVEVG